MPHYLFDIAVYDSYFHILFTFYAKDDLDKK